MHEHGITDEVVHQILHACEDENITNPKKIVVELGMLTTYKKEPIMMYFEAHKKEIGLLKNAKLEIIEIPGKILCNDCKKKSKIEPSPLIICPKCQSTNVKILQGDKVIIKEIKG
ncbi:hydrogenase maturation nickel metallochaperone HypA [Candidatus Woesearchaeota archaeon]|nr:hydrogenase maturation nickel metallochaperone HypA [Candidatus Woesearchaeota archaeon]